MKEHGYTDHGTDYGSRTACYTKGNDGAAIDMPGSDPDFRGTTYFFSIRWELGGAPSCL